MRLNEKGLAEAYGAYSAAALDVIGKEQTLDVKVLIQSAISAYLSVAYPMPPQITAAPSRENPGYRIIEGKDFI